MITSLKDAKIGDIAYNSKDFTYRSGHGCHTAMFIGTARQLGIEDTIRKYYRDFPVDAYLLIDIGWADGSYYHSMLKKAGIKGRIDLGGVGIQFFTSIKGNNGKYIYKSPYLSKKKSFSWKDSKTGYTFSIAANLERNRRLMQYKPSSKKQGTVCDESKPSHLPQRLIFNTVNNKSRGSKQNAAAYLIVSFYWLIGVPSIIAAASSGFIKTACTRLERKR